MGCTHALAAQPCELARRCMYRANCRCRNRWLGPTAFQRSAQGCIPAEDATLPGFKRDGRSAQGCIFFHPFQQKMQPFQQKMQPFLLEDDATLSDLPAYHLFGWAPPHRPPLPGPGPPLLAARQRGGRPAAGSSGRPPQRPAPADGAAGARRHRHQPPPPARPPRSLRARLCASPGTPI